MTRYENQLLKVRLHKKLPPTLWVHYTFFLRTKRLKQVHLHNTEVTYLRISTQT